MAGAVCLVILNVARPIKSFLFGAVGDYVGYIGKCDENLSTLRKTLNEVGDKKVDITNKVKEGKERQEEITREAASWLKDVRLLTEDEQLIDLMYKDIGTALLVVKMMEKKNLKRRVCQESKMQGLVVKVLKKLKEEMENSPEETRRIVEAEYKKVAEVVVEVMKDRIGDFKKLLKEDKKMALIATRMLRDSDLDKLTKGDQEMEEIVRDAGNASDEELSHNYKDDESNSLLVKIPVEDANKNRVKEAVKKLFRPLTNLISPLKKLMDDADFKEAVPHAVDVKLGLEVIDGLLIKGHGLRKGMDSDAKEDRVGCSSSIAPTFHNRYLMSKGAEILSQHIKADFISKCPRDPVTLHIRTADLKPVPTQFLEGLESRAQLLHQILENLISDQVHSVGVFGMGGTGKTTLVKEVIKRAKDAFGIRVMVEVSDAPDIVRIQATIAESIDLPLHDVNNVAQRATRLYNRLISEKEKKILIVLDNVWKKLNLDEIGIPHTCQLLLTTRDRDVCRIMDVRDANIIQLGMMNTNEARELFKSQTGNQVDVREYKIVVDRLLSKCGGLPLAIVATANSLKDKDLSSWEKFADALEKPISSQISGDYRHTFSVLSTSYKFIQPDGKRLFFLLASLSPLGSSLSIESLLRYGIGLNLFEHVNKLSEAMEQAVTWANELVLSSMLLEGDVKGDVKIHDIVRDFAISYAAKEEEHKFLVEGIPRWLDDKTLKKYTAMSLTSKNDYYRLSGVEAYKLQILILKGDLLSGFDEDFFNGMVNLEVLVLSNMNFRPSLPESMRNLKELRTLCMEGCKLGNIELVGQLVNLLVLSLRESFVESLPNEVGNLRKLRLLDLSRVTTTKLPLIPTGVVSKLSRLEGLYIDNRQSVFKTESDYEGVTESIRLPYLNALEIEVPKIEELPEVDAQFIKNLDKFVISIGNEYISREARQKFGCIFNLSGIGEVVGSLELGCLKKLLRKADYLEMHGSRNFEDLVPQLDEEGFRSLKYLGLSHCRDIKCIVDGRATDNVSVFPRLQSLCVDCLLSLEMVCNGDVPPATFSNLQKFNLLNMNKLLYGLPLVPRNVNKIKVGCCKSIKFIFLEDEEVQATDELPFLRKLKLTSVPSLLSLVGPKKISNTCDCQGLQGPQFFFDGKIVLPSLEVFHLDGCKNVANIWSKEICKPGFQNLKDVEIGRCDNLSSLGSHSVFSTLVQLETLSIQDCKQMHEVISFDGTEAEIGEQIIRFPKLKYLRIQELNNLESFCGGGSRLEFPKLKRLILDKLGSIKMFAKLENSSALFHDKINFPCLEELCMVCVNDEVIELWDKESLSLISNPVPMLRQLELSSSARLQQIPSMVLKNITSLTLTRLEGEDFIFSSAGFGEKEGLSVYSQLPNLEEIRVRGNTSLKELFGKDDHNAIDDAVTLFCGQIKTLELNWLPALDIIPLHLFKSIASLTLYGLKWNYLITAHVLEDSLHQLQLLEICGCDNMEALVIDVGSYIKLPRLKKLNLYRLRSFVSLSSTPKKEAALFLPLLELLEIEECDNLEHFWFGSIVAPRLHDVSMDHCDNLRQFLVGNLEDTIELPSTSVSISSGSVTENPNHDGDLQLPSMEIVNIRDCPNLRSFSLKRVMAPKLTQIRYNDEEYSMLPYDDLNHFLQNINPTSDSKDQNFDKH